MFRTLILIFAVAPCFVHCQEEEEVRLIRAAMPKIEATSKKGHKVLVYSKPWGYPHASIKIGKKMMQVMADENGLFEVTISDDLMEFAPGNLEKYDAVCLNNTTHLQKGFVKAAFRENLLKFVKNGGGLVAIENFSAFILVFKQHPDEALLGFVAGLGIAGGSECFDLGSRHHHGQGVVVFP